MKILFQTNYQITQQKVYKNNEKMGVLFLEND